MAIVIPNAEVFLCRKKYFKHEYLNQLYQAADEFVADMTKRFIYEIHNGPHSHEYVEIKLNEPLPFYQGISGDVLLYGHVATCYERRPLERTIQPFEELQLSFFVAGWYLIEVSDPNESSAIIFRLYHQPPHLTKSLWHKHHFVDEAKLKEMIDHNQ